MGKDGITYVTSFVTNDPDTLGTLDDFTVRIASEEAIIKEQRIKLLLNPKPRWLPQSIYQKILKRLIRIEEHFK